MLERMIGAAFCNPDTYEEIEADPGAIRQAIVIVLLVTVCGTVGGLLDITLFSDSDESVSAAGILLKLVGGLFFGIALWGMWVTLLLMVGGGLLRSANTQTSWAELGRVVGFAYTPRMLSLFAFVPGIGWLFLTIGFFWTLVGVVVAVRHALDFDSTGRAVAVVAITGVLGVIPWIIIKVIELVII